MKYLVSLCIVCIFFVSSLATAQKEYETHTVQKNQTLSQIATLYGVSQAAIKKRNPEIENELTLGTLLVIPAVSKSVATQNPPKFKKHKVRRKETLFSISKKYNVSISDIEKWNKLFELPLFDYVENYSTGMKKKLAFIGIIAMDRSILILDEPFNGVDIESNEKLLQLLVRLKSTNKIIIITSHIIESLTRICDRISLIEHGLIKTTFEKNEFPILEKELKDSIKLKIDDVL